MPKQFLGKRLLNDTYRLKAITANVHQVIAGAICVHSVKCPTYSFVLQHFHMVNIQTRLHMTLNHSSSHRYNAVWVNTDYIYSSGSQLVTSGSRFLL